MNVRYVRRIFYNLKGIIMKYIKKEKFLLLIMLIFTVFIATTTFAHPGRTDSNGGHKDNKNASGLGSYHYHCGGYPAHLHTNGVCPYTTPKVEEKVPEVAVLVVEKKEEKAPEVIAPVVEKEKEKAPEVIVPVVEEKEEETPKVIKPVVENNEVAEESVQKVEEEKKEIIEEPVQEVEKEEKIEEEPIVEDEIEEVDENVVETSNSTLEVEETENETVNSVDTFETGLGTLILLGGAGYLCYKKFKG